MSAPMMARIEAPIVANQALASASAIFSWAVRQEILTVNPCHGVDRNPTSDRERVLSDAELTPLWPQARPALKLILLTGQRPGEVAAMQAAHIVDGFWQMPGKPLGDWPGTKNGRDHRVALSKPALELIEIHLASRAVPRCRALRLKTLVAEFGLKRVTPHDLRRTALTDHTAQFGRDAMDRIANHRKGGVTDVYDRHGYEEEDRRIMAALARHVSTVPRRGRKDQRGPLEMIPTPQKITFGEMRKSGVRKRAGVLPQLPLRPPHHAQRRSLSRPACGCPTSSRN